MKAQIIENGEWYIVVYLPVNGLYMFIDKVDETVSYHGYNPAIFF